MGTFFGHALPGAFFMAAAIYWTLELVLNTRGQYGPQNRKAKPSLLTKMFRARMDTWGIIVSGLIGLGLEIGSGLYDGHGTVKSMSKLQHGTMYLSFACSGVVDLLVTRGVALPSNMADFCLIFAFMAEGLLFVTHNHAENSLDAFLHRMLVVSIVVIVFLMVSECASTCRTREGVTFVRNTAVLVHGAWFWCVAGVMYPISGQPWAPDHDSVMLAAALFLWVSLGSLLFLSLVFLATKKLAKRCERLCDVPCNGLSDGEAKENLV